MIVSTEKNKANNIINSKNKETIKTIIPSRTMYIFSVTVNKQLSNNKVNSRHLQTITETV